MPMFDCLYYHIMMLKDVNCKQIIRFILSSFCTILLRGCKRYGCLWFIACALVLLFLRSYRTLYTTQRPPSLDQATLDYIAENIDLRYSHNNTEYSGKKFSLQLQLKNNGLLSIEQNDWSIYFNMMKDVMPISSVADGYIIPESSFKIKHWFGNFYQLSPVDYLYKPLQSYHTVTLKLQVSNWQVSRLDVMPNWYVAAPGLIPRVLECTKGEALDFVDLFNSSKEWKLDKKDRYNPYTPKHRYVINNDVKYDSDIQTVFPTPLRMQINKSIKMSFGGSDWVVIAPVMFTHCASLISEKFDMKISQQYPQKRFIKLSKAKLNFAVNLPSSIQSEAYTLTIDPKTETIEIKSEGAAGMFYGVQSLLSLVSTTDSRVVTVPMVYIEDVPRYSYRGLLLDVSRNFQPKNHILKLLDAMAMMKLNKFHIHLSDDEGWRLEIPGLPELTEIGARRCHDLEETKCLLPQFGSGPSYYTSGSGYFTTDDYKDILKYAADRFIEVIPEFDMPGHARAAIKAMEKRSRKEAEKGWTSDGDKYLLSDKIDFSKYVSVQNYNDNAINPCMESTYTFIKHLVQQLKNLHKDIQPLKSFHCGGDEVPMGAWKASPECRRMMNKQNINGMVSLKVYFIKRVAKIVAAEGIDLRAWEDGLMIKNMPMVRSLFNVKNVYSNVWKNIWESGKADHAYLFANHGYKVVMSQATHLYFDHPYEPDQEERGLMWATRFISARKAFGFMPENLFENADVNILGIPVAKQKVCPFSCAKLMVPNNIVGMQAQMWGEVIRNPDQMYFMIFPRLFALAERSWHKASWEDENNSQLRKKELLSDWSKIANKLGQTEFRKLDKLGITYRIPMPGASIINGILYVNLEFPGLYIEMSTDQGQTWMSAMDEPKVDSLNDIILRTRSADGKRTSRIVTIQHENDIL